MAIALAHKQHPAVGTPKAALPRVGFIGLGWIGHQRMRSLVERRLVEAVALADPSAESLTRARLDAPDAEVRDSLDDLIACDLDGVVIATPSAFHASQARQAVERGLSVFCQKPLGRSAKETRQVVDTAEAHDRLLAVDFSYRHVLGLQKMREHVQEGRIGDVFAARAVFHNAYGPGRDWFYDRSRSGGGCVIDLGIHLVDVVLWTLGFPKLEQVTSRLYAGGRPYTEAEEAEEAVEDYAVARLDLEGGAAAEIACSWNLSTGCDAVIEVDFYGTNGSVSLRNVDGSYVDFIARHCRGRDEEIIAKPPDAWGGGAIVQWAERLRESGRFDASVREAVDVAEALDAIYSNGISKS